MDIMDMRVVITLLSFGCFVGIVFWAYSGRQKRRFDEAANLPFADDEMQKRTVDSLANDRRSNSINSASNNNPVSERSAAAHGNSEKELPHG